MQNDKTLEKAHFSALSRKISKTFENFLKPIFEWQISQFFRDVGNRLQKLGVSNFFKRKIVRIVKIAINYREISIGFN